MSPAAVISIISQVSSGGEMAGLGETARPMAIDGLLFYLNWPFYCSVKHSM